MIKTVTMCSVVCNRCEKQFVDDFNGIVAWLDEGTVKEQAMESEWVEIGDKYYCPDCYEFDDELVDRLSKLNAALKKEGFLQKVGDYQYKLMVKQSVGMTAYLEALEYRMADMNLDFKKCTAVSLNMV